MDKRSYVFIVWNYSTFYQYPVFFPSRLYPGYSYSWVSSTTLGWGHVKETYWYLRQLINCWGQQAPGGGGITTLWQPSGVVSIGSQVFGEQLVTPLLWQVHTSHPTSYCSPICLSGFLSVQPYSENKNESAICKHRTRIFMMTYWQNGSPLADRVKVLLKNFTTGPQDRSSP